MTRLYLNVLADLMETQPWDPHVDPDPYDPLKTLGENVRIFYRLIRCSARSNNRIGALVNAFFLGRLLEERASTPRERRQCRRLLTGHYVYACTRVYKLFSITGIQQLYRTQRIGFWIFRHLSKSEFDQLLLDALSLL